MTWVNAYRTPEERRAIYNFLRVYGFTPKEARELRDYTKPRIIKKIVLKKGIIL